LSLSDKGLTSPVDIAKLAVNIRLPLMLGIDRNVHLTNSFMMGVDFLPRHGSLRLSAHRPLMAQEGDTRDREMRTALDRHSLRYTRIPLTHGSGAFPAVGFGTPIPDPVATKQATKTALEVGFRHLDR
jgi:hypothetical protein